MNRHEILALLVADLREKLTELGLDRNGKKPELQNRLLAHYGLNSDDNIEEEVEVEDDEEEDGSFASVHSNNIQAGGNGERRKNPGAGVQNRVVENPNSGRSWFTLKDVEGSVSQFSGTNSPDVNQWIEELEECALTVDWSQLQVFIYAKQLLSGAAKLFIRSQRDVRDWRALKNALLDEFGVKVSSAEVHRRLAKRQQKKNESLQEYLYALMELAKPIDLDDESLIEYFVDGIPDSKMVELKVTKDGTEFVRRSDNQIGSGSNPKVQKGKKDQSSCKELLNEFQSLCMIASEQTGSKLDVELSHLPYLQQSVVKRMIEDYKPKRNVHCPVEMKILLTDESPVFQHARRIAYTEQKVVDDQIQEWLEQNIIKPSTSEYASPIVLVAKKNGQKRLCCDYRKLNEKIVRDNFPMVQMDSVIEKLQGATIFTTLDLTNGYFHVPVEVGSQKYTSFVTQKGQYEFLYVPFGISNSPAVFTRFIMAVLRELIKTGDAVVYMDDIIIPSKNVVEGPMEITKKRYNHILVVVDAFSKYVWLYPTRSTGVEEVLNCLDRQAIIFGNPFRIVSDRGAAFTSHLFKEYCDKQKIQHLLIATGVPRGNGQVERMHKIVVPMLSKMSLENPGNWYKHVGKVQQWVNNIEPRSTKVTPFKLLTGVDMRLIDSSELKEQIQQSLIQELDQEREQIRKEARENIQALQEENRRTFDSKRKDEKLYKVNDLVAIRRTQYGVGLKLKGKYLGPYKVVKVHKHGRYDVEKVGDSEGPLKTSTVAEFMKEFGANTQSGGPNVGKPEEHLERETRSGRRF
ncbi:uncharacterized protein [Drosophila takahashii]|uniref:uncharacterized protein n=1 Tax=Drosophila takahashii TaxID=29030 RepID=UPI0038992E5A